MPKKEDRGIPCSGESNPFISKGFVSVGKGVKSVPICILRDTGAIQSLLVEDTLPLSEKTATGSQVLIQGIELGVIPVPLHRVHLSSDLVSGPVTVGVRPTLPFTGVSFILGNDLVGEKVVSNLHAINNVNSADDNEEDRPEVYPAHAVTRAMANHANPPVNLGETFVAHDSPSPADHVALDAHSKNNDPTHLGVGREQLMMEQENDPELVKLKAEAVTEEDMNLMPEGYFKQSGILMRKWRPRDTPSSDHWRIVYQLVVPKTKRREVLSVAHESALAGHLGVNKTYHRILSQFFWPGLQKDVVNYCRSCHVCQMVGKPNQQIPKALLIPIPAVEEPFSRVIIDCVGPLPKMKSGNQYLLTLMCASTRFPEAVPLRNIRASTIVKHLIKFFTLVGLPKSLQSDQGSNFMSGLMQQVMAQLGVKQYRSSAYHSQGALEWFHQTLNMLRAYGFEHSRDWDEGILLVLFAAREAVQESLGFSPFELVFGRTVRGPLKVLKEAWLGQDQSDNLLEYVSRLRQRMLEAMDMAKKNLKNSQSRMKTWYDKKAKQRQFRVSEKVLALLPIPSQPLQARYYGPYQVIKKVDEVNYILSTPGHRKTERLCHINMLKEYHQHPEETTSGEKEVAAVVGCMAERARDEQPEGKEDILVGSPRLKNSYILKGLQGIKLSHLTPAVEQSDMMQLIFEFVKLFPDTPTQTNCTFHDVDVRNATPIKQHPYRLIPFKLNVMRQEIEYMLQNDLIEASSSEWSSPCVLVPKPDGTYRLCTEVNKATKSDSYPIPRVDDCVDKVGNYKYVTKLDLLKGYWQVPLSNRAKEISAFVTPDGLFQYKVMPFGMKNATATFQHLINGIISGLEGCSAYIDDVVVYSDTWSQHLTQVCALLCRLAEANLTVNLAKSEFGCAHIVFLGHVVGQGEIKPISAKLTAVANFPIPTNKRELMRFLRMTGYYQKFCQNFSCVASPLTNLLRKNQSYQWDHNCQNAFTKIKTLLLSVPVLVTPDYDKPFKLHVDASDYGAGAVLLQESSSKVDHPISFFSVKFNRHQSNYSTYEKETLALMLALQHF